MTHRGSKRTEFSERKTSKTVHIYLILSEVDNQGERSSLLDTEVKTDSQRSEGQILARCEKEESVLGVVQNSASRGGQRQTHFRVEVADGVEDKVLRLLDALVRSHCCVHHAAHIHRGRQRVTEAEDSRFGKSKAEWDDGSRGSCFEDRNVSLQLNQSRGRSSQQEHDDRGQPSVNHGVCTSQASQQKTLLH